MKKYLISIAVLLSLTTSCLSSQGYAEQFVNYAILYPQVHKKYEHIFLDIIQGIQQTARTPPVYIRQLDSSSSTQLLEKEFQDNNIDLVVALGNGGYQFSTKFENAPSILVGATHETIENFASLSLAASPYIMFDKLLWLAPKIKKVTIIYNPTHNQWFVKYAVLAAKKYNLTLQLIEVSGIKDAAQKYINFFDNVNPATEALLLPLDSAAVNETTTIPLILTRAWEQRVLVFSCNPLHAERGVLFSVYPSSQNIGQEIGDLINSESKLYQNKRYIARRSIFLLNSKTFKHLRLNVP